MRIARRSNLIFAGLIAVIVGGGLAVVGAQAVPGGGWLGPIVAVVVGGLALRRPLRRWRLARRVLPPDARAWLHTHVPLYRHLDDAGRARFERDVQFFLNEQRFEAVEGARLTPQHRLAVAAGAALMLHGRPDWELPVRRTILFYPGSFDDGYYTGDYAEYDGMVHHQGPVIFSTRAVEESWTRPGRGSNVVLHELAHLFDFDNAFADGVPSLMDPASAPAWAKLVRREMQHARIGRSLLRRYAATNPAELFAVAVENFFDRPGLLQRRHPELFDALTAFFNLDPRTDEDALEVEEDESQEAVTRKEEKP